MLSAKGFLYAPKERRAVKLLTARARQEKTTGLQLFGSDADLVSEAANQLSSLGFSFIDINMGCPAAKIVSNGEGSALLKSPALAASIVKKTTKRTHLPVTVKMRVGFSGFDLDAAAFARRMEDAGARALTVHARTRDQFYAGKADWRQIENIKRAVSIPVIGNGDIARGADAVRIREETGCDGIMIGRAAEGNPWIFGAVKSALRGEREREIPPEDRISQAIAHLRMMSAQVGAKSAVLEMRKNIAWYIKGVRGGAQMRSEVNALKDLSAVEALLIQYMK